MKKVFLWKPAKVKNISWGREVTEWKWLANVIDIEGKLFDKDATSLIASEVNTNVAIRALEYMVEVAKVKFDANKSKRDWDIEL